jgi:hypothetical protein
MTPSTTAWPPYWRYSPFGIYGEFTVHRGLNNPDLLYVELYVLSQEGIIMHRYRAGIELSEEEADALLGLCLTSPQKLDAVSERALRKLAAYCSSRFQNKSSHSNHSEQRKLEQAG